jgi:hypothetical protein
MVTHLTTNPPVSCLNRAERTGSLVFMILWSYVEVKLMSEIDISMSSVSKCLRTSIYCRRANTRHPFLAVYPTHEYAS